MLYTIFARRKKMERKRTINLYFLLVFLYRAGMNFITATYMLYLLAHGLDKFQANLVKVVFFSTMLLSEVPTGVFADVFGRRQSYLTACVLRIIDPLVYAMSGTFLGFACAEFLAALGRTCENGAFRAWMVDRLHHFGYHDESLSHIFGKAESLGWIAGMVAAPIGAYAATKNQAYPWIFSSIMMTFNFVVAYFFMKEEYRDHLKKTEFSEKWTEMVAMTRTGWQHVKKNEIVLLLVFIALLQAFAVQAPNMQWTPFFNQVHAVGRTWLGFIASAVTVFLALGATLAMKYAKTMGGERTALFLLQVVVGIGIVLTAILTSLPIALTAFFCHEIFRGMYEPLRSGFLHKNIKSAERATVDSYVGMAGHFGAILGLLFSGYVAVKMSMPVAWVTSGLVLVIGAVAIRFKKTA
jgi:MFS family permease